MNDALDSIIELNIAIANNDLKRTKVLVDNINQNIDNLHERFGVQNNICGTMGVYTTFHNFLNNSTLYAIENLNDVDSQTLIDLKDAINFNSVIENGDKEKAHELLIDLLNRDKYPPTRIASITRLINFTQDYSLFNKLREQVDK